MSTTTTMSYVLPHVCTVFTPIQVPATTSTSGWVWHLRCVVCGQVREHL